ncbi:MAG: tetratricopeptide repeat protein [Desulfobacula sp.]|nr:tetratricopeptide repeat protein [Desulfobacula sp.]
MDNKHILIIDDRLNNLKHLEIFFQDLGFKQTLTAGGADDGWVIMKQKKVDCVISAYEMKEMSGLALLKIIRKEDVISDIPFFLTDEAFTKIKVIKAGQTGVTGLFVVPLNDKLVKEKVLCALKNETEPVLEDAKQAFAQAVEFIEKKEYSKALTVFSNLVDQKDNPEYYFNIGYIKTSQGKHGEAIEAFSMATRLDKLFAKAYEEMGRVYKLMGDLKKAEEYMQLAAEIYMDTNKIGSAEEVLNEILESGTDSLNVFNTLGVIFRKKGDIKLALGHYQKALRVHPDEPYIYYNIGRLYLDMKQMGEAKSYFEQALEKDSGFEEAKQVIKAIDLGIV